MRAQREQNSTPSDPNAPIPSAVPRRRVLRGGLALALVAGVAACTDPPRQPRFPTLGFAHLPPFLFRAQRVDVRSEYSRPNRPPNIEHEMPLAPDRAAGQWAEDRLQANGEGDVVVRFTVHDASVVEKELAVERGLSGLFRSEQAESYHAQLEGTVEIVDTMTGIALAAATAKVWRSQTVSESATINERDSIWFGLVERLITDFDANITTQIETHLSEYLVNRSR
ncbi:hypothetical protein [Roseospira marina]|uniref:hypothetical protein n=1 Tax=Roseospira marina TaxID=140057 RepID=UPI00185D7AC3|nr:hypothetical protein [Roseospira marina]MBB4312904.1 hypothetical protein [Roseospira marina]MBB5086323.1 hypothetical protein [Roseospira marina]